MQSGLDPFAAARRMLRGIERALLDRILQAGSTAAASAAVGARSNIAATAQHMMTLLGRIPHVAANRIVDMDRGRQARPLSGAERVFVAEAYGARIPADEVRIVRGPGLSFFAIGAFRNGNPAITIGNTIYIKTDVKVPHADLSRSAEGIELLLHEYTHVVQYATLGFAAFGRRYLSEMRTHGYDANELYRYDKRNADWRHETLEGQAQIVGDYARARQTPQNAASRQRILSLGAKRRGTGIYAQ